MAYITQKPHIQSNGAFSAIFGRVGGVLRNIDNVLMSDGAARARIRKVEMLNAKSDEELAVMGLRREDIISVVFGDYIDT